MEAYQRATLQRVSSAPPRGLTLCKALHGQGGVVSFLKGGRYRLGLGMGWGNKLDPIQRVGMSCHQQYLNQVQLSGGVRMEKLVEYESEHTR